MVLNNLSRLWDLVYATSCWTTAEQPDLNTTQSYIWHFCDIEWEALIHAQVGFTHPEL